MLMTSCHSSSSFPIDVGPAPRLALGLVLAWASIVAAQPTGSPSDLQSKKPPTAQTHPNNPELWNVDAMMDEAATQIARRYNLNTAQENYTRLLLVKRTRAFLEVYESDVRELLKESIDFRTGAKPASIEAYMKWAVRAAPIYQAASKAILDGNEEWRGILTDDQKKIHDADLSLMRSNFDQVTRTMDDWGKGNTPAGRSPNLPPEPTPLGSPPKPGDTRKQISPNPPVYSRQVYEDSWLAYVNLFIDAFKLDEKQSVAARDKILKETRDQAGKYRDKHKEEFEALDKQSKSGVKDALARKAQLERPLREMFIAMDRRLFELIDSKQLAAVNPEKKAMLDNNYKTLAGKARGEPDKDDPGSEPKPAVPASQPAKSESSSKLVESSREKPAPATAPAD